MYSKALIVFVFLFSLVYSRELFAQCEISEPYTIADFDTTSIQLLVDGATNNDLGSNNSLCGVSLHFRHDVVQDLQIRLISPAGQSVILVGPLLSGANSTTFIQWDLTFVPCSFPAFPDSGFNSVWSSNSSWSFFSNYTGSYYPNFGCLEDFNVGTVNGSWIIEVIDGAMFDLGEILEVSLVFCEGSLSSCSDCIPIAGSLIQQEVSACAGSPDLILEYDIDYGIESPANNSIYNYIYILTQNNQIIDYLLTPDLTSYPAGDYLVYGLSIKYTDEDRLPSLNSEISLIEGLISSGSICAQITSSSNLVNILSTDILVPSQESLCLGDTLFIEGQALFESGTYLIYKEDGTCDELIALDLEVVDLFALINPPFDQLTCDNPTIILESFNSFVSDDTSYLWYSPDGSDILSDPTQDSITIGSGGTYILRLEEAQCISYDTIMVMPVDNQVSVDIIGEHITCTDNEVSLFWQSSDIISYYEWSLAGQPLGNTNPLNTNVAGIYRLEVVGEDGCRATNTYEVIADTIVQPLLLNADNLNCSNSSVIINNSGAEDSIYEWSLLSGIYSSADQNPTVSQAGIYQVVVNSTNGCIDSFQYEVFIDTIPPELIFDINPINCSQPVTDISVATSIPSDIIWRHENGSNVFNGNVLVSDISGTYYVSATGSNGCTRLDTILVEIDTIAPQFEVMDQELPCGMDSIQLINLYNPSDEISFVWSTSQGIFSTEPSPAVGDPMTYYVSAITTNGCELRDTIVVSANQGTPQFSLSSDIIDCNNPNVEISTGLSSGYTFEWSGPVEGLGETSSITVHTAGVYVVTVTDISNNCIGTMPIEILSDTEIPAYSITASVIDCDTPTAQVIFDGNGVDFVLNWSGSGIIERSDTSFVTINSDWFFLEGEAPNGCPFLDSIQVQASNDTPELVFNVQTLDCNEESFVLDYSTSIELQSFSWGGPNGFESLDEFPMLDEPGNYNLNFIGVNGCAGSASFMVAADATRPIIDIIGNTFLDCNVDSVTLQVNLSTDVTEYSWSGPDLMIQDLASVTVGSAGMYTVTALAANGCSSIDSFALVDNSNYPSISIEYNDINCYSPLSNIVLINDTPSADIIWSSDNMDVDGSTETSFSTQIATTYIVVVDAGFGCISMDSITVLIDTLSPVISTSGFGIIDCNVSSIRLDLAVNVALDSVCWSNQNGFESKELNPLVDEGGLYSVIVTATNGCTDTAEFLLEQDTILPPTGNIRGGTLSCIESKLNLQASIDSSVFAFYWEGPEGYQSLDTTPSVIVPGLYSLYQIGDNGCVRIEQTDVIDNLTPPNINAVDQNLPCNDDVIALSANSTDENVIYNWFGPNFYSNEAFPETNIPGQYVVIALGDNGCIASDTFQVTKIPVLPVFETNIEPVTCVQELAKYSVLDATFNNLDVQWILPDGTLLNESSVESDLSGTIELIVTGSNGCADTVFLSSQFDTIYPIVLLGMDDFIMCENREITLNSDGSSSGEPFEYNWSSADDRGIVGPINTDELRVNQPASYVLSILDTSNGCESTATIIVEEQENTFESLSLSKMDISCYGADDGEIVVNGIQGGLGTIDYYLDGENMMTQSTFDNLAPGNYLISAVDIYGCSIDMDIEIIEPIQIILDLTPSTEIVLGAEISLEWSTNIPNERIASAIWSSTPEIDLCIDCTTQIIKPIEETIYTLVLTDIDGCQAVAQSIISVNTVQDVFIPNVFSPNGDGINDVLELGYSIGVSTILEFHIFDRWGNRVFNISNQSPDNTYTAWDGYYKNKAVNPGVFAYVLKIEMLSGDIREFKGDLTVIR